MKKLAYFSVAFVLLFSLLAVANSFAWGEGREYGPFEKIPPHGCSYEPYNVPNWPPAMGVVGCIPSVEGPVPIPEGSQPYRPSSIPPAEPGYVEEEFFVSCTALGETYRTLIHVRRPENPHKFSGTVVAEPVHPSNLWSIMSTTGQYQMGAGHISVAIVSSSFVLNSFVKPFNPDRYASLNIPSITGIDLEILAQVGALLKGNLWAGSNHHRHVRHVILGGYSNTGATVRNFILNKHYQARLPSGGPIYDGYFPQQTAVGSAPTAIPDLDVPVIEIQGESELIRTFQRGYNQLGFRRPDSNSYRLYEVPGQPHMTQRRGEGLSLNWVCVEPVRSQFPLKHVSNMAMRNLVEWLDGVVPPCADRIKTENEGRTILRDEFGNALGGVRTSYLDIPIATYGAVSTNDPNITQPSARCDMLAYQINFNRDQLLELYRNHHEYVKKVNHRLDELVRQGMYLKRDADELRVEAAQSDVPGVPIPVVTGPIQVTDVSYPFMAANRQFKPIDLASFGYVEEEFFVGGSANVYEWNDPYGAATIRTPNAPYTARILVRRPANPHHFSGNVIVELLNNAYGWDFPFGAWGDSHDYFLSRGDVWVGLTSAPATVQGLKNFNPQRYAPLSWANPLPPAQRCNPSVNTEAGLIWDITSQVGALMKSEGPSNPLAGYPVKYVYGAGSTGGELATYINAIHPLAKLDSGKPVYDGYVIKSTGRPKAINQCASRPDSTDPRAISRCTAPVIRLFTLGDILGVGTHSSSSCQFRRPDSDDVYPYRHYELSGAWLGVRYHWLSSPCEQDVIAAKGGPFLGPFVVPPNEFPLRYILNGAFASLDRWVRKGTPPPRADPIEVINNCSTFVFDEFGNTVGGVRTPYVDVPIVTYPPAANPIPFDHALLEELYPTHWSYVRKVLHQTMELREQHWVTPADAEKIKTEAEHADVP